MANKGDIAFSPLSASTDGRPIVVTATASAGTTIHTCAAGSNEAEVIEIWASNISTSTTRTLYLELGGTSTSDQVCIDIRPKTVMQVLTVRLTGSVVIKAYEASGADVRVWGFMDRWTY